MLARRDQILVGAGQGRAIRRWWSPSIELRFDQRLQQSLDELPSGVARWGLRAQWRQIRCNGYHQDEQQDHLLA